MSVQYTRISEDEFDAFMAGVSAAAEPVREPGTAEKVYELPLPAEHLSVRVYSTIQRGEARGRGEDAIRCVVWSDRLGGPVGGRRKTLRIQTWRENLRPKIEDLYANWRDHAHGDCPECGAPLREVAPGQNDDWDAFVGCSAYDRGCGYTEEL